MGVTLNQAVSTLKWGKTTVRIVGGKKRQFKSAFPTPDFWDVWRKHRDELFSNGIELSKRGSRWIVQRWS